MVALNLYTAFLIAMVVHFRSDGEIEMLPSKSSGNCGLRPLNPKYAVISRDLRTLNKNDRSERIGYAFGNNIAQSGSGT